MMRSIIARNLSAIYGKPKSISEYFSRKKYVQEAEVVNEVPVSFLAEMHDDGTLHSGIIIADGVICG